MMSARDQTLGLVLAGGRSTRMGSDKSTLMLAGRPLILHAIERLAPQCAALCISDTVGATRHLHDLPMLVDQAPGWLGPLAGIEAGLLALNESGPPIKWLLSAPVDAPFLPTDLVLRLHQACVREKRRCALAWSGGNAHPTVALWHRSLLDDLSEMLHRQDLRRVRLFSERHHAAKVDWPREAGDPFFNVNTPEELAEAERRVG